MQQSNFLSERSILIALAILILILQFLICFLMLNLSHNNRFIPWGEHGVLDTKTGKTFMIDIMEDSIFAKGPSLINK